VGVMLAYRKQGDTDNETVDTKADTGSATFAVDRR